MPLPEAITPIRMRRIALVTPRERLRSALVAVADTGTVEFDEVEDGASTTGHALLSPTPPDIEALTLAGRTDLLAGEAQLAQHAEAAVSKGSVAALLGWCPDASIAGVSELLAPVGAAIVPLPYPPGIDPPTQLPPGGRLRRSFGPIVRTYGTVAYADIDPTLPAALAYLVMFGMMFGDAGHGALLVAAALYLRFSRSPRLAKLRTAWQFIAGAGLASAVFGVLYGEFFGPTGVLPVVWLAPLDQPVRLLFAGVGLGAVLLAGAQAIGVINRFREGGSRLALYSPSGIAGAALFLGLGAAAGGYYLGIGALIAAGVVLGGLGLGFAAIGLFAATSGGPAGVFQSAVQVFDMVIRLGANLVSFARLAAFGLTHAALGLLVWQGTAGLAGAGGFALAGAVLVFVFGNALAFGLEALVAGIQALRLEFYELFSRVFDAEGRPFRPWRVPTAKESS